MKKDIVRLVNRNVNRWIYINIYIYIYIDGRFSNLKRNK